MEYYTALRYVKIMQLPHRTKGWNYRVPCLTKKARGTRRNTGWFYFVEYREMGKWLEGTNDGKP